MSTIKKQIKTLYIIGNGFDIAHNINSSYRDFRRFLKDADEEFLWNFEKSYGFYPLNDDHILSEKVFQEIEKTREETIYESLWKNFEDRLGHPDESEIESTCKAAIDSMSDIEFGGIQDTLDDYFESQFGFIKLLQEYLYDWVEQIILDKAHVLKKDFVNKDLFLTFNYTPVLEKIYEISNNQICHIHGSIAPYSIIPPVIGHGNKTAIVQRLNWYDECEKNYDEGGMSMNRAFIDFYNRTLKNTDYYLHQNAAFFRKTKEVDRIQVIGHSLGEGDMPYFRALPANIPWVVYYHSDEDRVRFEQIIRGIDVSCIEMKSSNEFWERLPVK